MRSGLEASVRIARLQACTVVALEIRAFRGSPIRPEHCCVAALRGSSRAGAFEAREGARARSSNRGDGESYRFVARQGSALMLVKVWTWFPAVEVSLLFSPATSHRTSSQEPGRPVGVCRVYGSRNQLGHGQLGVSYMG